MDDFSQETLNPFDRFLSNPSLDMLNSALPYVGEHFRKPLALYIKIMEIQRIISDFDKEEILTACGFEEQKPNLEAMLKAMKAASGKEAQPQLDSMLQMLNFIRTYQSCMDLMQTNPELIQLIGSLMNQKETNTGSPDMTSLLTELLRKQEV